MSDGGLGPEIGKRGAFSCREEEIVLNLLRSNDRIQIRYLRLFRTHGLTPSQYNILRVLRGEGRPLPILEVASRMIAVVPGITGLIDRLEAIGLVARHRCEEDRRVVFAGITEKGLALLQEIDAPLLALHRATVGHLTDAEKDELIRLLEKARRPSDET